LSSEHVERRLAAILAADVAGSCRLIGIDEEGTLAQLKALRKTLFDPKITDHRGRIVKNTGDGALVEFASVVDAVRCADEIQRGMAEQNTDVPQDKRIEFRIGIHVGDIIIEDDDIFGDGVNIAVRLEGIAEPGGISISDDAHRQVRGKVESPFGRLSITPAVDVFALSYDAAAKKVAGDDVIERWSIHKLTAKVSDLNGWSRLYYRR
jgi:adenylate cyclase